MWSINWLYKLFSLAFSVGLTMLGFSLWGEPYKRGFFCSDLSLRHPYKDSTVRSWMLYLLCAALPVSLVGQRYQHRSGLILNLPLSYRSCWLNSSGHKINTDSPISPRAVDTICATWSCPTGCSSVIARSAPSSLAWEWSS